MKLFTYTAQCESGAAINGTLEADECDAALEQLTAMRLGNIELSEAKRPAAPRSLGGDDFIFFNEQLASLAGSGICLDVGLRQLGKDIHSRRLQGVLNELADDVESGQPLPAALDKRADRLPPFYSRVVRAGIESGRLPLTLLNLSSHLRMVAQTRRLVREALTYPAIVLVIALGLVSAIMLLVMPRFDEIFQDFGISLPGLTNLMINVSRITPEILVLLAVIVFVLAASWISLRWSPNGRSTRERAVLRMPLIGSVIGHSLRARFLRAAAFCADGGIPLPDAVRLSAEATASPLACRDADAIATRLDAGDGAVSACSAAKLIPPMFGYVVEVNSERGGLSDALAQLAGAYEARVDQGQARLRVWLAPIAVVGVGFMIGLLVLALFLPLISLIESVQC